MVRSALSLSLVHLLCCYSSTSFVRRVRRLVHVDFVARFRCLVMRGVGSSCALGVDVLVGTL
jgi:hypothetical protein